MDDTLSIRPLTNGNVELGVHIADVTHFLRPGTLTDLEARRRATTVYLADRRYDMLPAVLSGDVCSLLGQVDRYAVSVLWELDPKSHEVISVWYGRTVVRSSFKLFYEAAQDVIEGAKTPREVQAAIPELQGGPNGFHTVNSSAVFVDFRKRKNRSLENSINTHFFPV